MPSKTMFGASDRNPGIADMVCPAWSILRPRRPLRRHMETASATLPTKDPIRIAGIVTRFCVIRHPPPEQETSGNAQVSMSVIPRARKKRLVRARTHTVHRAGVVVVPSLEHVRPPLLQFRFVSQETIKNGPSLGRQHAPREARRERPHGQDPPPDASTCRHPPARTGARRGPEAAARRAWGGFVRSHPRSEAQAA